MIERIRAGQVKLSLLCQGWRVADLADVQGRGIAHLWEQEAFEHSKDAGNCVAGIPTALAQHCFPTQRYQQPRHQCTLLMIVG